jgi:hypothetical protein
LAHERGFFVRVRDGKTYPARPAPVIKNEGSKKIVSSHRLSGEGYVYRCFPGNVFASVQGGMNGWSDWVCCDETDALRHVFVSFNPYRNKKAVLTRLKGREDAFRICLAHIKDNSSIHSEPKNEEVFFGIWSLPISSEFGEVEVWGQPFEGFEKLMGRLVTCDKKKYCFNFDNRRFSRDLSKFWDKGKICFSVAKTIFDLPKICGFKEISDTVIFKEKRGGGREFLLEVQDDGCEGLYNVLREVENKGGIPYNSMGMTVLEDTGKKKKGYPGDGYDFIDGFYLKE